VPAAPPRGSCTSAVEAALARLLPSIGPGASADGASDAAGLEALIGAVRRAALAHGAAADGGGVGGSDALLALADGADLQLRVATAGGWRRWCRQCG
jgi:hypothetical protein